MSGYATYQDLPGKSQAESNVLRLACSRNEFGLLHNLFCNKMNTIRAAVCVVKEDSIRK
jgi:hypothetical protein